MGGGTGPKVWDCEVGGGVLRERTEAKVWGREVGCWAGFAASWVVVAKGLLGTEGEDDEEEKGFEPRVEEKGFAFAVPVVVVGFTPKRPSPNPVLATTFLSSVLTFPATSFVSFSRMTEGFLLAFVAFMPRNARTLPSFLRHACRRQAMM